jgi:hypothetical protein
VSVAIQKPPESTPPVLLTRLAPDPKVTLLPSSAWTVPSMLNFPPVSESPPAPLPSRAEST